MYTEHLAVQINGTGKKEIVLRTYFCSTGAYIFLNTHTIAALILPKG
jgi:hypothetical protein